MMRKSWSSPRDWMRLAAFGSGTVELRPRVSPCWSGFIRNRGSTTKSNVVDYAGIARDSLRRHLSLIEGWSFEHCTGNRNGAKTAGSSLANRRFRMGLG